MPSTLDGRNLAPIGTLLLPLQLVCRLPLKPALSFPLLSGMALGGCPSVELLEDGSENTPENNPSLQLKPCPLEKIYQCQSKMAGGSFINRQIGTGN